MDPMQFLNKSNAQAGSNAPPWDMNMPQQAEPGFSPPVPPQKPAYPMQSPGRSGDGSNPMGGPDPGSWDSEGDESDGGQPNVMDDMQLAQMLAHQHAVNEEYAKALKEYAAPGKNVPVEDSQDALEIIKKVMDKVHFARLYMDPHRFKWLDIYRAYKSDMPYTVPVGVEEPESMIKTSLMGKHIDKMVSINTMKMIQPVLNFISIRKRFSKQRCYAIANYVFDLFKRKQMAIEIIKAVKCAGLFGVGFTKVLPDYMNSQLPECTVEAVNNFDIFVDPCATSLSNMSFIVHRVFLPHEVVVARMNAGYYDKEACMEMIQAMGKRDIDQDDFARDEAPKVQSMDHILGVRVPKADDDTSLDSENGMYGYGYDDINLNVENETRFDRYTCFEYHDGREVITIGEGRWLLQKRTNPIGYPFQAWYFQMPVGGEFWVKSHGEYLLPMQKEMDVKRNQRIANINKLDNPPFLYTTQFGDVERMMFDSGRKLLCRNLEEGKWMSVTNNTDMLLQEMQYIDSEAADRTNVVPLLQGNAGKKERMTGGEASAMYGQANLPFEFDTSIMTLTGLLPMIQQIMKTLSKMVRPTLAQAPDTPDGKGTPQTIMPRDFAEDYDIELNISPTQEAKDKQEALDAYQLLSQDPYIDQVGLRFFLAPMLMKDFPTELIKQAPDPGQMAPSPQGSAPARK